MNGSKKDNPLFVRGSEKYISRRMVRYIWDYYKIHILLAVAAIFLIIYFLNIFLDRPSDPVLHVTLVNCYKDVSEHSSFYQDYADVSETDMTTASVVFDATVFFDLSKPSDYRNVYFQKTVAYLEAGTTDAIICQYDNLQGLANGGRLLDLEGERTASLCEKYKDAVVYVDTDKEKHVAAGIDITGSPALQRLQAYEGKCYLAVSAYTKRLEAVENFADYLMK